MSDRINVRLNASNQKRVAALRQYIEADPMLSRQIQNDNQLFNYVLGEFIFLFVSTNPTPTQDYVTREKKLLAMNTQTLNERQLIKRLRQQDKANAKLMYLLLAIYNRSAGDVGEGGSIFAPGAVNNTVNQLLNNMVEDDLQHNELKQN